MTLKRIHVNQAIIRRNHKTGSNDPVLTVKSSKTNRYAHEVNILWLSKHSIRVDGIHDQS